MDTDARLAAIAAAAQTPGAKIDMSELCALLALRQSTPERLAVRAAAFADSRGDHGTAAGHLARAADISGDSRYLRGVRARRR